MKIWCRLLIIFSLSGALAWLCPADGVAASLEVVRLTAKGVVPEEYSQIDVSQKISRGEFIRLCILAASYGEEAQAKKDFLLPFADVSEGDPLGGFYAVAYERGLVAGYSDRTLRAGRILRRGEAASFLLRLRHSLLPFASSPTGRLSFADENLMSFSMRETGRQAVLLGYLRTTDGSRFSPNMEVSYGEALGMIQAFINGTSGMYDFEGQVSQIARGGQFAEIDDRLSGQLVGVGLLPSTIILDRRGNELNRPLFLGAMVRGMLDERGNLTLLELLDEE